MLYTMILIVNSCQIAGALEKRKFDHYCHGLEFTKHEFTNETWNLRKEFVNLGITIAIVKTIKVATRSARLSRHVTQECTAYFP